MGKPGLKTSQVAEQSAHGVLLRMRRGVKGLTKTARGNALCLMRKMILRRREKSWSQPSWCCLAVCQDRAPEGCIHEHQELQLISVLLDHPTFLRTPDEGAEYIDASEKMFAELFQRWEATKVFN